MRAEFPDFPGEFDDIDDGTPGGNGLSINLTEEFVDGHYLKEVFLYTVWTFYDIFLVVWDIAPVVLASLMAYTLANNPLASVEEYTIALYAVNSVSAVLSGVKALSIFLIQFEAFVPLDELKDYYLFATGDHRTELLVEGVVEIPKIINVIADIAIAYYLPVVFAQNRTTPLERLKAA